jgi:hypothetical protein
VSYFIPQSTCDGDAKAWIAGQKADVLAVLAWVKAQDQKKP